jgi:chromate reductase, NAD(P)H dehydrogenase (quinone)
MAESEVEGGLMEQESDGIRIVVLNGSVRPGNYTRMASALVVDELKKDPRVSVDVIDPEGLALPPPGTGLDSAATKNLQARVLRAAGVVLATPEYHGSFSSVMKLMIENLGFPSVLAGKTVALLGVAAGSIGAIKSLEHLRGVVSHVGGIALPLPVSVANVQRVFDHEGHCLDPAIEEMIRGVAGNLMGYIHQNVCPRLTLEKILREGPGSVPQDILAGKN